MNSAVRERAGEAKKAKAAMVERSWSLGEWFEKYAAVVLLFGLIIAFTFLEPDTFPTHNNATAVFNTQAIVLIVALGTMVPLIAGEFDLSVGFVVGWGALESAKLMALGVDPVLAVVITLLSCLLIGMINGLMVVFFRINAFIATLGVGTVLSGFTLALADGTVVNGVPASFVEFGRGELWGFNTPVFMAIGVVLVCLVVLDRLPVGRYLYAIGGGREAARLAGIKTTRLRLGAFAASAAIAGFAGIMQTATAGSATPEFGPSFLLPAFAACFLGATVIKPGRFNTLGTVIALLVLAVGIDGLQLMGAPAWVGPVFNGSALLIAVGLSVGRRVSQGAE